ncbi:MAG TPA: hypothetical protein VMZ00_07855 [Sporichthya sp.]|nr:hypothetical protein [Sporichthya sp.]
MPALAAALVMANAVTANATPAEGISGFSAVDSSAQGQMGSGYLFAVGDEVSRLVGANAALTGPPDSSQAIAAFFQRGAGATYAYDFIGGGQPGKAGALPQPPPGEAAAYYPANPPEALFAGPISTAAGTAADGRFYALAKPTPAAIADAAITNYTAAGQFSVEYAHVLSHTEPLAKGGVLAESTSTLFNLTIGPLTIRQMVSHAVGQLNPKGAPTAAASTVVYGATVAGQGVEITDHGVIVGGNAVPGGQESVNAALAQAGLSAISILPTTVGPGDTGDVSVNAVTGGLRVVYKNNDLGANNPQGFSGGGFSAGGAEIHLLGNLPTSFSVSGTQQDRVSADHASAAPADKAVTTRRSISPNRSEARTETLDATLTASRGMTPQVATRLEKGYLAFGFALLALAVLGAWRPAVRIRSRR